MLPTAHTSPLLTSSTPSSWAPVAPAGIGTATVLHAWPSQCSARGWLLAERASDAPTAQASLALPAATELKNTSFRPSMPPGFGGLPAIRQGLETGPAAAAAAAGSRRGGGRAERERGHTTGGDMGGAGQAGDRDQGRAGLGAAVTELPERVVPPAPDPAAGHHGQGERATGRDRLGLAQPGHPQRHVALPDPPGEAVPPGELELAVVAPDPDRTVRQQGHRVLLPRRDRRDPGDLGDRRRDHPQADLAADAELAQIRCRPRPSRCRWRARPASAARRPRSRSPRTGPSPAPAPCCCAASRRRAGPHGCRPRPSPCRCSAVPG